MHNELEPRNPEPGIKNPELRTEPEPEHELRIQNREV
jgi:hypothetical protein